MVLYYVYNFVTFFSTWQYFMFSFQCQLIQLHIIFNDLHRNPLGQYSKIHLTKPLLLAIYAAFKSVPVINKPAVNIFVHTIHALEEFAV